MSESFSLSIKYCVECDYQPQAVELTEHLLSTYQRRIRELTLLPDERGVFEVRVDGELIFSKRVMGRFPTMTEIDTEIDAWLADA